MSQDWAATTVIGNRGAGRGNTKSAAAVNAARRQGETIFNCRNIKSNKFEEFKNYMTASLLIALRPNIYHIL